MLLHLAKRVSLFLIVLFRYVFTLNFPIPNIRHTRRCTPAGKTLNFLGNELWLSVQQADPFTAGQTCFLVLYCTLQLCIYIKLAQSLIKGTPEGARGLEKTLNYLGIELWLSVLQAGSLTAGQTTVTDVS